VSNQGQSSMREVVSALYDWDKLNTLVELGESLRNSFLKSFDQGVVALIIKSPESPGQPFDKPLITAAPTNVPVSIAMPDAVHPFIEILLATTSVVGLTLRSYDFNNPDRSILRIVRDPLSAWSNSQVTLNQIKEAAKIKDLKDFLDPLDSKAHRDFVVETLLLSLEKHFSIGPIQAHPRSLRQWVSLRLPENGCFTQVMDAIGMSLSADWTWSGNGVFLGPPSCTNGCQGIGTNA